LELVHDLVHEEATKEDFKMTERDHSLCEMVHELKEKAAINDQFNSAKPTLSLSTSEILPPTLPKPLGSSDHAEAAKEDFKKADPTPCLFMTEP